MIVHPVTPFQDRLAVVQTNQNIGRLEVSMHDAFIMGVLNGLADGDKQVEAILQ